MNLNAPAMPALFLCGSRAERVKAKDCIRIRHIDLFASGGYIDRTGGLLLLKALYQSLNSRISRRLLGDYY